MSNNTSFAISVIVTVHNEGTVLHHTIQSILGAIQHIDASSKCEIIVHADNPTEDTAAYIKRLPEFIPETVHLKIFTNTFGNPGASRNFALTKASGKYVTFIDGDDLMSTNWLHESFITLEKSTAPLVAHSEYTIEFGDSNSIVKKYTGISKEVDSLLSVWSGRWNAIIFVNKAVLESLGYPEAKDGYGFEDWEMSCKFISADISNVTIPETVMFVRRKTNGSVWNTHRSERAVLRKNDCMSFDYVRSMREPESIKERQKRQLSPQLERLKRSNSLPLRVAKKVYKKLSQRNYRPAPTNEPLPEWLIAQWKTMHTYDRSIFPSEDLISNPNTYHTITDDHYWVGHAYKQIVDQTSQDSYDYLLFTPWIIKGGADLYAINFANELLAQHPELKIAIIATMPNVSITVRSDSLNSSIDYISLSPAIDRLDEPHVSRLLEQLIENSGATTLHVINSMQAYDFIRSHKKYIQKTNKTIVATSFSQSVDPQTGRLYGYSHTHVPTIYDVASLLTTDNHAVADMWVRDYGFDKKKIQVIRPLVLLDSTTPYLAHTNPNQKIIWAARLAPEKLVELVPKIAQKIPAHIHIDMYGTPGEDFDKSQLNNLPTNLHYRGTFSNFYDLPLNEYSAFLYTSLFDGLPNALVEATSVGLPIIASDAGGISEFISNNKTGLLIKDIFNPSEYADAITQLVADPELARRLTNEAQSLIATEYSKQNFELAIKHYAKRINLSN